MYTALEIAKYCIYYCTRIGRPVSNPQLQKILYYVQASFLVKRRRPCFRESIKAWKNGPVVEPVYIYYRNRVADAILENEYQGPIAAEDRKLIEEICNSKSSYSAMALVSMTQQEAPWSETETGDEISVDAIHAYFNSRQRKLAQ